MEDRVRHVEPERPAGKAVDSRQVWRATVAVSVAAEVIQL